MGEYKVICEEMEMESEDADGNTTTSTIVSYSTYDVDNDALYFTNVEDTTDENVDSSQYALMVMYKDGSFAEYSVNISVRKQYDSEDKTQATETTALGLYFTGADENDKPNLESVLDDWGEYTPNYFSGTFDLKQ